MAMSPREQWLRDALADVLCVEASQVSITASFAELGVDSLTGLRLTRRLQDWLDTEAELEWLFDNPSIAELSRFLDARLGPLEAQ